MRWRDASPSGKGASEHLYCMELSQMSPQIVRNDFRRPPRSQLKTQKRRIVLARQNLLLQKSAQAHWHSKHEEQLVLLFIFDTWVLPLYSDWSSLGAQSALNWLLHLESGGGVGSNFGMKMELSEQEPSTRTQNCKQLRWWHTLIAKTCLIPASILYVFALSHSLAGCFTTTLDSKKDRTDNTFMTRNQSHLELLPSQWEQF
jgi:hypothetical protein